MCGKCFKLNGLTQFLIYGEGIEGYTACHILSCQIYVSDHFSHRYVFPGIQIITEGKSPHRNEDTKVLQSTAIGWVTILSQLLFCSIQGLWCFEMQGCLFYPFIKFLYNIIGSCWHNCQWDLTMQKHLEGFLRLRSLPWLYSTASDTTTVKLPGPVQL